MYRRETCFDRYPGVVFIQFERVGTGSANTLSRQSVINMYTHMIGSVIHSMFYTSQEHHEKTRIC